MARLRIFLAALLAIGALAVLAGPATASVAAATNPKFCKAVAKIGNSSSSQPTKDEAKTTLKGFKNAARYAPRKVKSALNTIAKYLGVIANANSASDLADLYSGSRFRSYTSAIGTYVKYYSTTCIGAS